MPTNTIKSFAKKTNKKVAEVEKMWSKAKAIAKSEGKGNNFAYITGVLKNMLKLENKEYLFESAPTPPQRTQMNSQQQIQEIINNINLRILNKNEINQQNLMNLLNAGWSQDNIQQGLNTIETSLSQIGWNRDQIKAIMSLF
jgi:uncharacterized membrane protein